MDQQVRGRRAPTEWSNAAILHTMPSNSGLLDTTNLRLLEELQVDARLSHAELGRRVGLSAPAVAERLSRLEREGVIAGYRAEVAPAALGYSLAAVLRMRPAPRQIPAVA